MHYQPIAGCPLSKKSAPVRDGISPAVPPFLTFRSTQADGQRFRRSVPLRITVGFRPELLALKGRSPGRLKRELQQASLEPGLQPCPSLSGELLPPTFLRPSHLLLGCDSQLCQIQGRCQLYIQNINRVNHGNFSTSSGVPLARRCTKYLWRLQ
jgi:hypothetical protein